MLTDALWRVTDSLRANLVADLVAAMGVAPSTLSSWTYNGLPARSGCGQLVVSPSLYPAQAGTVGRLGEVFRECAVVTACLFSIDLSVCTPDRGEQGRHVDPQAQNGKTGAAWQQALWSSLLGRWRSGSLFTPALGPDAPFDKCATSFGPIAPSTGGGQMSWTCEVRAQVDLERVA